MSFQNQNDAVTYVLVGYKACWCGCCSTSSSRLSEGNSKWCRAASGNAWLRESCADLQLPPPARRCDWLLEAGKSGIVTIWKSRACWGLSRREADLPLNAGLTEALASAVGCSPCPWVVQGSLREGGCSGLSMTQMSVGLAAAVGELLALCPSSALLHHGCLASEGLHTQSPVGCVPVYPYGLGTGVLARGLSL